MITTRPLELKLLCRDVLDVNGEVLSFQPDDVEAVEFSTPIGGLELKLRFKDGADVIWRRISNG